ncbi:MAG: hypothetical protein U5R49_11710 [Deltaproteobacteria bacterium]|nr:hypothetical protein [Deltaproteobacteria bacterium]
MALVSALEKELSKTAVWLNGEEKDPDLIIAVQGCPTACTDVSMCDEKKILSITGEGDISALIAKISRRDR